jgi:hypothetical protein
MTEKFNFAGFEFPRQIPMLKAPTKYRKSRLCCAYRTAPKPLTRDTQFTSFYLGDDGDFQPGLRMQYADEVVNLSHQGSFADDYESDTIRGVIFKLPKGRGYLAGWTMGPQMISQIQYDAIYESCRDAAYAADELARVAAEESREAQAEYDAKEAAEEAARQALVDMQDAVNESVDKAGWMQECANV